MLIKISNGNASGALLALTSTGRSVHVNYSALEEFSVFPMYTGASSECPSKFVHTTTLNTTGSFYF